uniref:UBR-type domain-containing protein n=1 Tax=Heterorhabditis bacteriophora TaxID=37862 RepID=A0A1I7WCF5_HETBA
MTVTRRGGPTALPMVIRRTDEPRPLQSTPLCTYSSTEKEFVQQHWYNCHTCKMTDNKGVCSICAVNCHRGHDLSYSKLGLFFCDSPTENIAIDSPPVHLTAFDIQRDLHIDSEDIMECLNRLRHGLEEKVEIISRIVDASVVAHDSRWTLTKRRDDVRQSLADPDKLVLVYDQAIMRVDTEPIGFAGRRLACRDEKIAIAGLSDVLALRMSKEGDIIDRTVIKLSEMANTHSNPVVKAIWSPYRPALLAVGTVQLVRVYDLTLDADNCLEELVLPVGMFVNYVTKRFTFFCTYIFSNVEDIEFMRNEESDEIRVLVLSTAGHLYEHKLTSLTAENTSYFLTNTIDLPHAPQSTGSGVLDLSSPVHCWQESSGVMACLSHPIATPVVYIYPTLGQILVQVTNFFIFSCLYIYIFFRNSWSNLPDLWMENMPNELCLQQDKDKEEPTEDLTGDDLVTVCNIFNAAIIIIILFITYA